MLTQRRGRDFWSRLRDQLELKFIGNNKIADWQHAYQTKAMIAADNAAQKPSFRQLYDVTSTPILYLLDKDKRIIGKKLTIQQMNELLEEKIKKNKTN